mmetsp:Transcript_24092/g.23827  ORF Transcript_24092/g.23827 Transcript_24092/m.23827 type:complete len:108 (+) Transcript_24092:452-775(+)
MFMITDIDLDTTFIKPRFEACADISFSIPEVNHVGGETSGNRMELEFAVQLFTTVTIPTIGRVNAKAVKKARAYVDKIRPDNGAFVFDCIIQNKPTIIFAREVRNVR